MNSKFLSYLMLTLVSWFMFGCSTSISPNSMPMPENNLNITIIKADSTRNNFSMKSFSDSQDGAIYNPDTNATSCIMLAYPPNSVPYSFIMSFSGSEVKEYEWEGLLSLNTVSIIMSIDYGDIYHGIKGKTRITKYGKVGETVEGNFEGSFFRMKIPTIDTVLISGSFVLKRNENR